MDEELDLMPDPVCQSAEPAPEEKQKKKMAGWLKGLLITVAVILILLLMIGIVAFNWIWYLTGRPTRADGNQTGEDPKTHQTQQEADKSEVEDATPMNPDDEGNLPDVDDIPTPPDDNPPIQKEKDVVNILIVGQDSKNTNIRTRSDTMIMVTVHTKAKQVTLTSFMRDAYVKIPGYSSNKLNSAYEKGGLSLLNETLKVNFGIEIDGNVIIDFNSFKDIINMLGGVDISLTAKEAEYMVNGGKHNVKPGMNRLNGQQALDYARLREIDNDYKRANRQRTVMLSLIERYKTLPLLEMVDLVDDILPFLVTDMERDYIMELVFKCGPVAPVASYGTQQIPADGTYKQGYVQVREGLKNWFQYNIDFDKNRDIIESIMNGRR